jgi:ATP-binding cassette subfamily F protein 3
MQHRDFDLAQSSRWNYLRDHSEQRNLLNLDIILEDLTLCTETNHGRVLLDHAKLSLLRGHRYGIVGRNGVGKTTLLRHIADHKIMGIYNHLRCIYVNDSTSKSATGLLTRQQDVETEKADEDGEEESVTVLVHLLGKHQERLHALKQLRDVLDGDGDVDPEVLEAVVHRLMLLEADAAESRARTVLHGLGVSPDAELRTLSGGWRQRATLATALFLEADVLLLDEPTNHLDIHAIIWLEEFLSRVSSTVVVVSHDFEFLDHVVTDMLEFNSTLSISAFKGNFTSYLVTKQGQIQQQKHAFKCQEIRRKRIEATIEKLRIRAAASPASSGAYRMIRSRQQELKHRLGVSLNNVYWKYSLMGPRPEILAPLDAEPFEFEFPTDVSDVPEAGKDGATTLVGLRDVGFGFGCSPARDGCVEERDPPALLFQGVTLTVTLSSRIGLIGENGSGKTTLLKIIAEELKPSVGDCIRWSGTRIAYFHQDSVVLLDCEESAINWLHSKHPRTQRRDIIDALGSFGVMGLHAEQTPVRVMSSGEKARLLLSDLLLMKPHILLLDEPTSFLDAETSAAIVAGLESFDGAVVLASHDRTFMAQVVTELFCMDSWMFGPCSCDLSEYRDRVVGHAAAMLKLQQTHEKACTGDVRATCSNRGSSEAMPPQRAAGLSVGAPAAISCRHCAGEHFSHSCPQRPQQSGRSLEKTERERAEAVRAMEAEAAKPKPKPKLPPTTVVENNEVWHVAVSKSMKRRLAKGV